MALAVRTRRTDASAKRQCNRQPLRRLAGVNAHDFGGLLVDKSAASMTTRRAQRSTTTAAISVGDTGTKSPLPGRASCTLGSWRFVINNDINSIATCFIDTKIVYNFASLARTALMSTTRFYACRLVGPPSAEVCRSAAIFP